MINSIYNWTPCSVSFCFCFYSFNHFSILFLHSKGQKSASKQYPRCEVCHGRLKYWNYRYCSLACKAGFQAENQAEEASPAYSERSDTTEEKADNDDEHDQEEADSNRRRKRRKGTPQRSPLK